jgi:hypothetical protein
MGKREETRRFWTDMVSRYERAGQPRKVFAANHDVGLAALQYWICKLRREAEGARRQPAAASSELRLVPVRVAPQTTATFEHAGRVEIRFGGLSIRVPLGTDPRYLASVVAATRAAAC